MHTSESAQPLSAPGLVIGTSGGKCFTVHVYFVFQKNIIEYTFSAPVRIQEAKYEESWPNMTSAWAG
jgi:hypothetical protein